MNILAEVYRDAREMYWYMGWGGYAMAAWLSLAVLIVLERSFVLYVRASRASPAWVGALKLAILDGDTGLALRLCAQTRAPCARVVARALEVMVESPRRVQGEVDAAALGQIARLSARTRYLPVLANLALLSGIFASVVAIGYRPLCCCCCGESVDPSQKARILAEVISEAMNTTAFGLGVAIVSVFAYAILQTRAQRLHDELNAISVQVVNLALAGRQPGRSD